TATYCGTNGYGTIYKINTDGTGFTVLHSFTGSASTNDLDGANPYSAVILISNVLYGTTAGGGLYGGGTVFKINTNGSNFTVLHNFGGLTNGSSPQCALIVSNNVLYGTTSWGGIYNNYPYGNSVGGGTVFKINTDGSGFATLHDFEAVDF